MFWDVNPKTALAADLFFCPADGESTFLLNIGEIPDYTASRPRKQHFS
jgi:hypothetical protein